MGAHACIIVLITCLSMELAIEWPIIYCSWTVCHHNLSLVVFLMFILVFGQVVEVLGWVCVSTHIRSIFLLYQHWLNKILNILGKNIKNFIPPVLV